MGNLETVTLELAEEKGAACLREDSQAVEKVKGELQRPRSVWRGDASKLFFAEDWEEPLLALETQGRM